MPANILLQCACSHSQFRFADCTDRLLLLLGIFTSVIHGLATPFVILIFGSMSDSFIDDALLENILDQILPNITALLPNTTRDDIMEDPRVVL